MLNNAIINFTLDHLPKEQWDFFSTLCASLSLPHIGSPISFRHKTFTLNEYPANQLPPSLKEDFLSFCYPDDLPDRLEQIDCDIKNYWNHATTFIVTDASATIVGCVQIIHRDRTNPIPVEFGSFRRHDGSLVRLDLSNLYNANSMTEIYRCRRAPHLRRLNGMHVLIMLFKAIIAHTIEYRTPFSFISFDKSRPDLQHLYLHKCDFSDTGIDINFEGDSRPWRLLRKNWFQHEKTFATKGKTQFFLQTWYRNGLRKKHLTHYGTISEYIHDSNLIEENDFALAEVITSRKRHKSLYRKHSSI